MSAKQILDVIDDRSVALATVPKPFLTGDKKTASRSEEKKEVSLTIVVVGSE
jgi:hypothetical protein